MLSVVWTLVYFDSNFTEVCSTSSINIKSVLIRIMVRCWKCGNIYLNQWWPSGLHDDVIKWKYFPRNWPFVRGIHRSPVNCPHKGQWRGALMFSLICVWINDWVNNRDAGDLRRYLAHYDVIVMGTCHPTSMSLTWIRAQLCIIPISRHGIRSPVTRLFV